MIAKIDDLIKNLDGSHSDINSIFSSGAVEGYSAEFLWCNLVLLCDTKKNKYRYCIYIYI